MIQKFQYSKLWFLPRKQQLLLSPWQSPHSKIAKGYCPLIPQIFIGHCYGLNSEPLRRRYVEVLTPNTSEWELIWE